jgi:hypothetical protein
MEERKAHEEKYKQCKWRIKGPHLLQRPVEARSMA